MAKKDQQAVVKIGSRQFIVKEGDKLLIDKLSEKESKKNTITLKTVLAVIDGKDSINIGSPTCKSTVTAKVKEPLVKGKKIIVQKYKPKIRYQRKQGHRQQYSLIEIEKIAVS